MQRGRRKVFEDGEMDFLSEEIVGSSSPSGSMPISSPPSGEIGFDLDGGTNCILHTVSRFDTLAGVAIRYGVEVADIKRLNGFSTDLQMFALKTLQIPLPGRHPPSPSICNGHITPPRPSSAEQTQSRRRQSDLFDSFQSLKSSSSSSEKKVSPAMSSLQGYYGLSPADKRSPDEGFEMTVYHRDGAAHSHQDGLISSSSPHLNPPLSLHRKSRSVANSLMSANGSTPHPQLSHEGENNSGSDKWFEKLLRRRQKSESDFASYPPEKLLKEEVSCGSTISTITGKGLALRPKSSSRTVSLVDGEPATTSPFPMNLCDSLQITDSMSSVRKSSSTSCLQDADNGTFSSLWSTSKWSLKPDFQALSSAAIPIFDGLPKAIGKKNKTALD